MNLGQKLLLITTFPFLLNCNANQYVNGRVVKGTFNEPKEEIVDVNISGDIKKVKTRTLETYTAVVKDKNGEIFSCIFVGKNAYIARGIYPKGAPINNIPIAGDKKEQQRMRGGGMDIYVEKLEEQTNYNKSNSR